MGGGEWLCCLVVFSPEGNGGGASPPTQRSFVCVFSSGTCPAFYDEEKSPWGPNQKFNKH